MSALSICPYCKTPAKLVTGKVLFRWRADLAALNFWRCDPCDAHVGCHRNGTGKSPLGRMANPELRKAKQAAHAAFDPLWQSERFSRRGAYKWLSEQLGTLPERTHIGEFDVQTCERVVQVCAAPAGVSL